MEIGRIKIYEKTGEKGLGSIVFFFSLCTAPLRNRKDYQWSDKEY